MTRRAASGRAFGAIAMIAAGAAVAGCIGQASAHSIGRPVPDGGPVVGAAPDEHPIVRVAPVTGHRDRDLDGVDRAVSLVTAVPAATPEAPPFVCEIMDMDAGSVDAATADGDATLLASGP
jgi:hypothetical protein